MAKSRRRLSSGARASYARKRMTSRCRKVNSKKPRSRVAACNKMSGCKVANGRKRTFCRKSKNHVRQHVKAVRLAVKTAKERLPQLKYKK